MNKWFSLKAGSDIKKGDLIQIKRDGKGYPSKLEDAAEIRRDLEKNGREYFDLNPKDFNF